VPSPSFTSSHPCGRRRLQWVRPAHARAADRFEQRRALTALSCTQSARCSSPSSRAVPAAGWRVCDTNDTAGAHVSLTSTTTDWRRARGYGRRVVGRGRGGLGRYRRSCRGASVSCPPSAALPHPLNRSPPLLVQVNDTAQEVEDSLCTLVASNMRRCILDRGAFTLAIPGGSAAKALAGLPAATAGVDWSLVHIFFVNERLERKNLKLARVGPRSRSSPLTQRPKPEAVKGRSTALRRCAAGGVRGAGGHTSGPAVHPPGW
jgi:hypothetical protein